MFLGIYRGTRSSEFSEGAVPRKFPMTVPRNVSSELPRIGPSENPSVYSEEISDGLVVLGVSSEFRRKFPRKFRGKKNFRGVISEDLFRRYVVGITLFRRHTDDFFPQYVAVFL